METGGLVWINNSSSNVSNICTTSKTQAMVSVKEGLEKVLSIDNGGDDCSKVDWLTSEKVTD